MLLYEVAYIHQNLGIQHLLLFAVEISLLINVLVDRRDEVENSDYSV
jgi:hypothetical protein